MAEVILPPAFLFLAAAILLPGLPMLLRNLLLLTVPLVSGWIVWNLPEGLLVQVGVLRL